MKNTQEIEFSFSGLKTALLWQVKKLEVSGVLEKHVNDLCASFQKSVVEALISKIRLAVKITGIKKVTISGGVSANSTLRRVLLEQKDFSVWLPEIMNCTDNAVMIALAGYNAWQRGVKTTMEFNIDFNPDPSLHEI